MQIYDALDEMFADRGTTANAVSHELFNNNLIQSNKSRGSVLGVVKIAQLAEHCGYELCLVPESSVPRCAIPISPDQSKPKMDDGVRLGDGAAPDDSGEDMIG